MQDVEQASQPTIARLTPGVALCNFAATVAPTTGDDETQGYAENSVWYLADGPPFRLWKCVDATEGVALWREVALTMNGLVIGETFIDGSSGNILYNNGGVLGSYTPANALTAILPSQTGNSGKVLQTNGTAASWQSSGSGLTIGTTAITSGTNDRLLYQSGGVVSQSSNLRYDGTNFIVGVAITSPHTGSHSERFGLSSQATGEASSAFGKLALATADNTTAIGYDAQASSNGGVALGKSSRSTNTYGNGVAIGKDALASGSENPTAIGQGAVASGNKSVAIGSGADATADSTFAMGYNALANAAGNMAIGYEAISTGAETSIAIGKNLTVSGNNGIGIGAGVSVTTDRGIGIGDRVSVAHSKSIALGQQTATTADNQFIVGSASAPVTEYRQVYDGSTRYLFSLSSAGLVTYDGAGSGKALKFASGINLGFFGATPVSQRSDPGTATVGSLSGSDTVDIGVLTDALLDINGVVANIRTILRDLGFAS